MSGLFVVERDLHPDILQRIRNLSEQAMDGFQSVCQDLVVGADRKLTQCAD